MNTQELAHKVKSGEQLTRGELESITSAFPELYAEEDPWDSEYTEVTSVVDVDGDLYALEYDRSSVDNTLDFYTQPRKVTLVEKEVVVTKTEIVYE